MPIRRRPYQRAKTLQRIRLTLRDKSILETIHVFDGLLSLRQIDRLFFSGKGRSQPRARMRLLFDNGYVSMPSPQTIHQIPTNETVYWLAPKGASIVAGLQGLPIQQFRWRKKPRFSLIEHDLQVNNFRMTVGNRCHHQPELLLETWIPESEFAINPDKATFDSGTGKTIERTVRPDGFFWIKRMQNKSKILPISQSQQFAFLLEIDMGTEDNPRFAREKIRPGVAYLRSKQYVQRFGIKYGRYLVVTTSQRRLHNMKAQAEQHGGNGLFYFTTFTETQNQNVLGAPIWQLAGYPEPRSIIPH